MPPRITFSDVLAGLWQGKRYRRRAWKNALFIFLVPGSQFAVNRAPLLGIYPEGTLVNYAPHIDVVSVQQPDDLLAGEKVSTWAPWMGDLLADDWHEVDGATLSSPQPVPDAPPNSTSELTSFEPAVASADQAAA